MADKQPAAKRVTESVLARIANIVVAPIDENVTELYLATSDGKYGYFRVGGAPTDNFRFNELTPLEYIQKTQHLISSSMFKTQIGAKK